LRTASEVLVSAALLALCLDTSPAGAQANSNRDALARAVASTTLSFEAILSTSERYGTPLAAEFEIEDGRVQVSVIVIKGDAFIEVTADPWTGRIVNVETITEKDSVAEAAEYQKAMQGATKSLRATVVDGVQANAGYRAIRAEPVLENGHPILEITLVKGLEFKTIELELD
jgi:hypothetical protein